MNSSRSLLGLPKLRCVSAVCNSAGSVKPCPSAAGSVDKSITQPSVSRRTLVVDHQTDIAEQRDTLVVVE